MGPCPLGWRTTKHWNVGLKVFQSFWHTCRSWKTVGTIFQCIIVFKSRGQYPSYGWIFYEARLSEFDILYLLIKFKCWTFLGYDNFYFCLQSCFNFFFFFVFAPMQIILKRKLRGRELLYPFLFKGEGNIILTRLTLDMFPTQKKTRTKRDNTPACGRLCPPFSPGLSTTCSPPGPGQPQSAAHTAAIHSNRSKKD